MKTQLLKASLFCTSLFLFQSCTDDKSTSLKELKWMLGNWESKTDEGVLFEDWKKFDDSTYNGHAYAISEDGDTTFNENARVILRNGNIIYSVKVQGEDAVDFTLVDNENEAVFENVNHDYPQRIIYKSLSSDSLFARIEGTVDGVEESEDFRYRKAN